MRVGSGQLCLTCGCLLDKPVELPCGRCIGCKLERARQWAVRCMHEAALHEANCFVTLTYEDDKLPPDGGLRPRDFVLFMKRLRKRYGNGIRFFHCGEYGEKFLRPHHHVLLFNHDWPDKRVCRTSKSGESLYSSGELESLWDTVSAGVVTSRSRVRDMLQGTR